MRAAPILALVLLLTSTAGCTSKGIEGSALSSSPTNAVTVQRHDGSTVEVNVSADRGALVGHVMTDDGLPLRGAVVALWGVNESAITNQTGWFEFLEVEPGKRPLRADYSGFRAAESEVDISAGKATEVTIVMVPLQDAGAGYRPHTHDYWGGKPEIQVIDRAFDFNDGGELSGMSQVNTALSVFFQNWMGSGGCGRTARDIVFNAPDQTVFPGTGSIRTVLTWTQQDFVGEEMFLTWHTANSTKMFVSPPIKKGAEFALPVAPGETDSGHQRWSLWRFAICPYESTTQTPRAPVLGKIHVSMKLVRGHDPIPEPPHPAWWANGSEIPIVGRSRLYAATQNGLGRTAAGNGDDWGFAPAAGAIVPPGAKELTAKLEWSFPSTSIAKPLSLTYRPANVDPHTTSDPATLKKMQASATTATSRTYTIPLTPDMTDAFYQQRSTWLFYLNWEGQENDAIWRSECVCDATVKVTVTATKDPSFT